MKNAFFHIDDRIYNLQDSFNELISLSEIELLVFSVTFFALSKFSLLVGIVLSELVSLR